VLGGSGHAVLVDRVVATVGIKAITRSALQARMKVGGEDERTVLDAMIDDAVIAVECERRSITVGDDEVDAGVKQVAANADITYDELLKELARRGLDLKSYRASIRAQLLEGKWLSLEAGTKSGESAEARLQRIIALRATRLADLRAKAVIEVRL
jgi:hypothetical protein